MDAKSRKSISECLAEHGCDCAIARPDGCRIDAGRRILIVMYEPAIGKPRMTRRDKWAQRPCVLKYRDWCDKLRRVAGDVPPANDVESLNWTAWFEPPKSWSKKKKLASLRTQHRSKPDRDNIDKAVLDCLWKEDSGIAVGTIGKFWGHEAGIVIEIVL